MSTIERRVALLEQADAPPVVRLPGESIEEFLERMGAAIAGVRADTDPDGHLRVIRPWLAAMTHEELREFHDSLEAVRQGRSVRPGINICSSQPL